MITSILEYSFSDHYFKDADNRFKYRVKDVELLNNFQNPERAKSRFRQVMYDMLLTKLDRITTAVREHINFGLVFGEVVFVENGKIIPAIIKGDKNVGNLYVGIIKGDTVVTLELLNSTIDNLDILRQLNEHEKRSSKPVEITALKDINGLVIPLSSNKRPKITISLDMPDAEFYNKYKTPTLVNNKFSAMGLSEEEVSKMQKQVNQIVGDKPVMAGHALTADMKQFVPEKEWVINTGSEIYVRYPDGIKKKTLDKIEVDETVTPRKYALRFKNTLALYPLNIGNNFISSPKQQTDTYNKLKTAFDLKPTDEVNFEGPIKRFMDYRKKGGGIGIVIDPKSIVY